MEALLNNLINAIGWSIIHSFWQGAMIYGILLLIVFCLPKLSARIKHNIAFGALCLLFSLFCITFILIFEWPATHLSYTNTYNSVPHPEPLRTLKETVATHTEYAFPYLVGIYLIGMFIQMLIISFGYQKISKLKRTGRSAVPIDWNAIFHNVAASLNLQNRKIEFFLSEHINVPLVIGYFKPVVLFPIAVVSQLDINQVEAILIHELSHIRRNDYLLNLIKKSIETILFFNPFIWLSGRFIQVERENACDDMVLKFTGTPLSYAHALLKLELLKTTRQAPVLSLAATGKNQHLYERIKRITAMKTNHISAKQQLFAFTLIISTVISLAWISPLKKENKEKPVIKPNKETALQASSTHIKHVFAKLRKIHFDLNVDTPKKKTKIKIVATDDKGNKKEYNSPKELPDSLKNEWLNLSLDDHSFDSVSTLVNRKMNSPEFKKQMTIVLNNSKEIAKMFDTPEWKAQQAEIQKHALEISKQFSSPEWKKQQEEIQKQALSIRSQFNSPEWKKQQEQIVKNALELTKTIKLQSLEFKQLQNRTQGLSKKHNAQQLEDRRKLQESQEYKELKKKFDKDIEKIKKKKGIKSSIDSIQISLTSNLQIMPAFSLNTAPPALPSKN